MKIIYNDIDQMVAHAYQEAYLLKQHATDNEKSFLNYIILNPDLPHKCIYGLMTNSCYSPRAKVLMLRCAKVLVSLPWNHREKSGFIEDSTVRKQKIKDRGKSNPTGFTPIEALLLHDKKYGKKIIDFLQGKRKTLKP